MLKQIKQAVSAIHRLDHSYRNHLSIGDYRNCPSGFPAQANGSLIYRDGKPVASSLIGQPFTDPKYFWSRPSATAPMPYNAGVVERLESGTDQSRSDKSGSRTNYGVERRPIRITRRQFPSIWSRHRPAAWTRISARQPPNTRSPAWRKPADSTRKKSGNLSPGTPKTAPSACWANRE